MIAGTYNSAAPGAQRGARGTDGPTRTKPSPFAFSDHVRHSNPITI